MKQAEPDRIKGNPFKLDWVFILLKRWRLKGVPLKERGLILTIVILTCLGVVLMIWGKKGSVDQTENAPGPETPSQWELGDLNRWSAPQLERDLLAVLMRIKGVGRVQVVITLAESVEESWALRETREERRVNEQTKGVTEEWRETKEPVLRREKDGTETPIRLKTEAPKIAGVLVVAEGAQNPSVKRSLWEATATALKVPLHHVMVLPWGE